MEEKKEPKKLEEIFAELKESKILGILKREGIEGCYIHVLGENIARIRIEARYADVLGINAFKRKIPLSAKYVLAYKRSLKRLRDEGYNLLVNEDPDSNPFNLKLE